MACICFTRSKKKKKGRPAEIRRERGVSKRVLTVTRSSTREAVVVVDSEASARKDVGRTRLMSEPLQGTAVKPESLAEEGVKVAGVEKDGGCVSKCVLDSEGLLVANGDELHKIPPGGIVEVPNGVEMARAAAGWPLWLTSVAGEAVKGWLPRRAESFEKLDKIGQGTYSSVYRARDIETGKVVALKKVRFVNMDPESVRFMAREIHILRRLNNPNVVKLEGLVTSRRSSSLYLVFEYLEHDLVGLAATRGTKFSESQVKCYMQQLLSGLFHCHTRGVLHRDIKGSNLLIDNNGILKIADFGLATFFNPDMKQQLTSRVVTLWYRPPELLLGATEYGVAVDLWSSGCILAELLAGKPIMPGRTEVEQLHKIFKLCGSPSEEFWRKSKLPHATIFKPQHPYRRCVGDIFKDFPSSALDLLDILLAVEPADRGTASSALKSEFFTTDPLPCDPSSLPKYPPSKELDAKLRDEEARRQRAAAIKARESESGRDSKVMQLPDVIAEARKKQLQANPASRSYKFDPRENSGLGSRIDPPKETGGNGFSHASRAGASGSSSKVKNDELQVQGRPWTTLGRSNGPELRTEKLRVPQGDDARDLSSRWPAKNTRGMLDNHQEKAKHLYGVGDRPILQYNHLHVANASEKQERYHHVLDRPGSSHRKDDRMGSREQPIKGYSAKKDRILYSGPLMPPGGNMEEMLKEHERQIQQAVRKSRLDKTKIGG